MRLGAWLLSKGKITEDQLQKALQHRDFFGGRIGSSLIALGFIDEDVLGAYLSDVSGTPYAPVARLEGLPPEIVALVPARLAAQYRVIPIGVEGRRLRLAMRDPRDLIALDEIAFMTGMTIEPYVATDFRIQKALTSYYQVATGTRTVPLAGATAGQDAAAGAPPTRPGRPGPRAAGAKPRPVEIGLDGYPLDADPDQIDNPFNSGRIGVPLATGEADVTPPNSLQQWRQAQEEIPEEIPEPAAAAPPPAGTTAPIAAAAADATPAPSPGAAGVGTPAAIPAATEAGTPAPARATSRVETPVATPGAARPGGRAASPALAAVPRPEPGIEQDRLDAAAALLQRAQTRDEVLEAILDFASDRFRHSVLFIVHPDRFTGWGGRGPGIDPARVRGVVVPSDRPSLLSVLKTGADHYFGPVGEHPANIRLFVDLGIPVPERALIMPLMLKERPMLLLYCDTAADATATADRTALKRVLGKAALALEILILRNKIGRL